MLEDSADVLWFADADPVNPGERTVALEAWWGPSRPGVSIWRPGNKTGSVRPGTELAVDEVGTENMPYPATIPDTVPLVGPDDVLVLSGGLYAELTLAPVIPSEAEQWVYLGAEVGPEDAVTRVEAKVDVASVETKEHDNSALTYLRAGALPQGRYALYHPDHKKLRLVDFGAPSPSSFAGGERPEPAEEEGEGEETPAAE